jgi:hypothetical protein
MGLLDEAIREHLELKRRRGADPSVVAREEQEALTPVFPDEDAGSADEGDHPGQSMPEPAAEVAGADAMSVDGLPGGDAPLEDPSTVGQDTAELDMQAVLEEDSGAAHLASLAGPTAEGPVPAVYARQLTEEDSLEWEAPGEADHGPVPEDVPGQERLSFD